MALIDEEEIWLEEGLNILTGETGAGKSIIIGSISAALGISSMKELVKEGAEYAMVELTFETGSLKVRQALDEMQLPMTDDCVIITRNWRNGRSVSRINGENATVARVREIASCLIDIHGQHEHQSLLYPRYHLELVDSFADQKLIAAKESCRDHYQNWKEAQELLDKAMEDQKDRLKQIDFLTFEIGEIDEASLKEGEDEELEARFRKLSNARKILETASEVEEMTGSDNGALMYVSRASGSLARISDLDEELENMSQMLVQIEDLCDDFSRSLNSFIDSFSYDERELDEIRERLDLINHLKTKYGKTIEDILAYREQRSEELERLKDLDSYVQQLEEKKEKSYAALCKDCSLISNYRRKSAEELAVHIKESLVELNFLDVQFEIQMDDAPVSANGADSAVFLISTNPGISPHPLQSVVSGGELSRIMLGIKAVMARKDAIETLIFDEIDTGISGRTAQKVAEKMAQLSGARQVIAITHLAQIAAMADHHYLIEKRFEDGVTHTHVRLLDPDQTTEELARILGGAEITENVLNNAREMKKLAGQYKDDKYKK